MEENESKQQQYGSSCSSFLSRGLVQCWWSLFFLLANWGLTMLVLALAWGGFFFFVAFAFGCSSFLGKYTEDNGAEHTTYFGIWQQQDDKTMSCQNYPADGFTQNSPAPLYMFIARFCAICGLLVSVTFLLVLLSTVCVIYPRSKMRAVGLLVGLLMTWCMMALLAQEFFWPLCEYGGGDLRCKVNNTDQIVLCVCCWFLSGLGTRYLGDDKVSKCRFRGQHNIANSCAPQTDLHVDADHDDGFVPQICACPPPSMEDILTTQSPSFLAIAPDVAYVNNTPTLLADDHFSTPMEYTKE